jgi:hypothetical protein
MPKDKKNKLGMVDINEQMERHTEQLEETKARQKKKAESGISTGVGERIIEKHVGDGKAKLAEINPKKMTKRSKKRSVKIGFDRSKMSKEELRRDTAKFRRNMKKRK